MAAAAPALDKRREELVGKRFLFIPLGSRKEPPFGDDHPVEPERNGKKKGPAAAVSTSTRRQQEVSEPKLKFSQLPNANWISGWVRCASSHDDGDKDLQVCIHPKMKFQMN